MNSPLRLYKKLNHDDLQALTKSSQQNYHIAVGYEACNDVLLALMKHNIQIESVSIGGAQPCIRLLSPPTRAKLTSSVISIQNNEHGQRIEKHSAFITGCRIEWVQPHTQH